MKCLKKGAIEYNENNFGRGNMFIFLLCISLVFFILGMAYAVRMKMEDRIPWQSFLLIILIVTAVSMWMAVLPLVNEGSFIYKPLYAAFYMLESAIGNVDYSLFSEALENISFWRIYTILLHLLMPATAYGVILLIFMKAFGWFRYTIFRGNKKIILLSDLTGKSKAYAKRIKDKDTLLIFCDTDEEEKKMFDDDTSGNMIFTAQSELQILRQLEQRNLTIMEMGEDENRNVQKSVEIIHYLTEEKPVSPEDGKTINIFTVSGQPEAETIIDNIMRRSPDGGSRDIRLTLINEEKRITFKLLHEAPLYEQIGDGTDRLDIMIVGFGTMGQEILKGISWAGCFPDVDTNVHIICSQSVENGRRLLTECPELGVDLRHNGGFLKPEKGEQINPDAPIYYYSAGTDNPGFDKIVQSLAHCRYIVVSLDDDAATLAAAFRIYRLITREQLLNEQQADPPEIHVRIRDDNSLHLFSDKEDSSILNHFRQFGSDEDIYSVDQAGQSVLDHLAKRARNVYRDEHQKTDEKSKYAYLPEAEKNANMTAALHVLYKLHFFKNITIKKADETLSDSEWEQIKTENRKIYDEWVPEEERLKVADWEHIRWQAYMRTEGYVHCPYEKIKKVYDRCFQGDMQEAARETRRILREARMHPCIGDGDTHLKKIAVLLGDQNDEYHFHSIDRHFVNSIPEILGGVYKLVPVSSDEGQDDDPV